MKPAPPHKSKFRLLGLLAVAVFAIGIYIIFFRAQNAAAAWFDESWAYRKAVTLTITSSASDITDLQTLLTIDTTGITASLQTNCEDLRFTNALGQLLPYYIDTCSDNSATNKVWVLADLVPKNTTTYALYMYYGNPTAAAGTDASTFWSVKDLEGYWTLNDTSGDRTDSSVNSNTLTDNNTVTSATGQFSNAGQFTAATLEYLSRADNTSLSTGDIDFTIAGWVYFDSLVEQFIVGKYKTDTEDREYLLYLDGVAAPNERLIFLVSSDGTALQTVVANNLGQPAIDTWYFIVMWHDASADTINIQVNDGAIDSGVTAAGVFDSAAPLRFGSRGGPTGSFMDGRIDDVRMYKRVLTAYERSQLYTNPGVIATTAVGTSNPSTAFASEEKAPGPVAYWKFDDGTGTNAQDSTSNNLDGTISGATWQTEDLCITGKCLWFDGSNDVVTVGDPATGSLDNIQTISAWIRTSQKPAAESAIVAKANVADPFTGYRFTMSTTGYVNMIIRHGGVNYSANSQKDLTDGSWHHVAGVQNGSNILFYVDGIQVNSGAWSAGDYSNSTSLTIGESVGLALDAFNGFIDEVKIYPYARTAAQVATDYASRGSVKGSSASFGVDVQRSSALANGLVGYWKLDETSTGAGAVSRADSSGSGNTLTDVNTVTSATGKFGNAGQFTRVNSEELTIVDNASLSCGDIDFSVSAWVYFDSLPGDMAIVGKSTHNVWANIEYSLFYDTATQKIIWAVSDGVDATGTASTSTVTTGVWYFVVGWHDSVANTVNIQLDNGAVTSTSYSSGCQDGGQTFRIGNLPSMGYMNGRIEEVRMYKRVLSQADRTALYNFAPGPLAYWKMDENQGATTNDSSGNANTSSAFTGNTAWTQGKFGSGLSFDGTDDVVRFVETTSTDVGATTSSYTVSAWMKTAANYSGNATVLAKDDGSGAYPFELYLDSSEFACFQISDGTNAPSTCGSTALNDGKWHYLTGARDVSADKIYIYVDGIQINSATDSTTATTANDDDESLGNAGTSYTGNDFNGQVDDAKMYNYARTSGQIVQDMNAGHPAVGSPVGSAVGWWKFDEGADNTCSGGTNDACNSGSQGATLDGAKSSGTWTNSGKFGKALNFNGSTNYVSITDNPALDISSAYTLTMWVNLDQLASTKGSAHSLTNKVENSGGNSRTFYTYVDNSTDRISWIQGTGSGTTSATSDTALAASTWYHVTFVLDDNLDQMRIYLNGKLDMTPVSFTATPSTNNSALRLGGLTGVTGFTDTWMDGTLDEVKIYNYALTADQVKTDMNRGSATVIGALSDNSSYEKNAANQEYCIPGDSTSCASPIGRWDFEEAVGATSANDTTGTAAAASITGATYTSGKIGKALNFNGGTDTATVSTSISTKTVEFWVNPSTTTQNLIDLRTAATAANISVSSGTISATGFTSPTIYVNGVVNGTISANAWNHVAVTTGTAITANAISFGRISSTSLTGKLDSIRFFDYARSAAQVVWDYNRGAPVGHWKFDECQGTSAYDSSTNGNGASNGQIGTIKPQSGGQTAVGTCTGSAGTMWADGATGKYNSSLDFDGTDDVVHVTRTTALEPTDISISGWIKLNNFTKMASVAAKQYNGTAGTGSGGGNVSYGLFVLTNAKVRFSLYNGAGITLDSPGTLSTGTWYHLAATFSGSTTTLYINGLQVNSGSFTGPILYNTGSGYDLELAKYLRGDPSFALNGQLDDVRIYNYALTAIQIRELYNSGAVRFGPSQGSP